MYPPRSSRRDKNGGSSKRKGGWRGWVLLNLGLLLMITAIIVYTYNRHNPAEQPLAEASPSPSAAATPSAEPSPAATPESEPTPEPSVTPEPAASPEPSAETEAEGETGLPPELEPGSQTVKLSFAGDVMFAGKVEEALRREGFDYPYRQLGDLFRNDDYTVINLETAVTERGDRAEDKQYAFRSPPEALDPMKAAGIDAVSLANNHTLDWGVTGLKDTMDVLSDHEIPYVGAGRNAREAFAPHYVERGGMKIAILGFTRVIPETSWKAGAETPGLADVYDSALALKTITEAKSQADLVVVMAHWGKERERDFNDTQRELGRSFIDAGADLVIGSHPHVLQGLEPYNGKWIAYSTGNFIFTRSTSKETWETAVFQAECSRQGACELKLTPMHAELGQPVPMNAEDGLKLLRKVEDMSRGMVKIGEDGKVKAAGT